MLTSRSAYARRRRTAASIVLLGLVTGGCADLRVGTAFDPDHIQDISPRRTTTEQVRQWLGAPLRSVHMGDVRLDVHKHIDGGPRRLFGPTTGGTDTRRVVLVTYRDGEVMQVTDQ